MTKKQRIAELERRIEELETELANLRGQPMLAYGRVPQPIIPARYPDSAPQWPRMPPISPQPSWQDRSSTGDPLPEPPRYICETNEALEPWIEKDGYLQPVSLDTIQG